jgi:hypothetical protein
MKRIYCGAGPKGTIVVGAVVMLTRQHWWRFGGWTDRASACLYREGEVSTTSRRRYVWHPSLRHGLYEGSRHGFLHWLDTFMP